MAIIGGGCASIAAAFELSRPEHNGKYAVTVYQLGWRLGGKGASGRGVDARIEEHGFHVWFGFYENAFRLMRECYAELARDSTRCRIADWRDAFFPASFVGFASPNMGPSVQTLVTYFPPAEGLPGDPIAEPASFSVESYLIRTIGLLRMLLTGEPALPDNFRGSSAAGDTSSEAGGVNQAAEPVAENVARLLRFGAVMSAAAMLEALGIVELMVARGQTAGVGGLATRLAGITATAIRGQMARILSADPNLMLVWHALDLGITAVLGILRDGLLTDPRGFDAINDYDFRDWMRLHGASEHALASPLLRASYDLAFAYEDGDYSRPRHAAGVAMRGTLRMLFTYRGSFMWKMSAGMGDVVFAPFYEVLKRRGVNFEFFHRLERINLGPRSNSSGANRYVESLDFAVQAKIRGGAEYAPLIDVDGLACWPEGPDFNQLEGGDRLRREGWEFESHWDRRKSGTKKLGLGADFDIAVLGVGLGAIPYVASELIETDQRWRELVTHVKTVETQCFQIWLKEDMAELGWERPGVALSAFAQPFETWADMSHLVEEERLPDAAAIAYFCSTNYAPEVPPLADTDYPRRRREEVRRNAVQFLNRHITRLWPGARSSAGTFRWDRVAVPSGDPRARSTDEDRFATQFWTANIDPTARYVISVPGSPQYRISPLDNAYDNLTVAGDWTACGLDTGCVESAFISGRLAASAIAGLPRLEDITGYDHP